MRLLIDNQLNKSFMFSFENKKQMVIGREGAGRKLETPRQLVLVHSASTQASLSITQMNQKMI